MQRHIALVDMRRPARQDIRIILVILTNTATWQFPRVKIGTVQSQDAKARGDG